MKKTIVVLLASVLAITAFSRAAASFNWSETIHDFGSVTQGQPVSHEFEFTNNGSEPLVITSVQASCGCTATAYTQEAIAPGEKGFVRTTYNAAKSGAFTKTVTVLSNTSENTVLTLKGTVVE
jgi:hypothetical protein